MSYVPWLLVTLNVTGAAMMVKWGLPPEVPFFGRDDSDPVLGIIGLTLFVTSIATRIALTITSP